MEAAIELLSMLRQSNASLTLFNKIEKMTKQYYIQRNNAGKLPSWEVINTCLGHWYCLGMSAASQIQMLAAHK